MYRAETQQAARDFVEDLRSVLDKCAGDTQHLKRAYNKGPLGTGAEAVSFSRSMGTEMEQIRSELPMLKAFSEETPRARDMLSAAFEQLEAITNVFDRFEERLESGYGIAPVRVPIRKEKGEIENEIPNVEITRVQHTISVDPSNINSSAKSSSLKTPSKQRSEETEEMDLPIPKTPCLEDFGISNEDLRGLGMGTSAATPRLYSGARAPSTATDALGATFENGDVEEIMQKSISELGIETPVQVAEKFENRRHRALTKMMITTTPRLKSGGMERTIDYTGLADGYYAASTKKEGSAATDPHRQLNFDETPQVRRVGNSASVAISQRIADNFDNLGFWREKVTCEALQEAAVVLQNEGDRSFDKHELTEILGNAMPGRSYYSIIISLTKLKVLKIDTPGVGEESRYRMVGAN